MLPIFKEQLKWSDVPHEDGYPSKLDSYLCICPTNEKGRLQIEEGTVSVLRSGAMILPLSVTRILHTAADPRERPLLVPIACGVLALVPVISSYLM